MKPIYNHNSEDSAYVVDSYPYGFKDRCIAKFWLESNKKGFRLVMRTRNPKNGVWNKPKKSVYASITACMYLDDENKVNWKNITEYSSDKDVLSFIENFPEADMTNIFVFASLKCRMIKNLLDRKLVFTINGEKRDLSDDDFANYQKELAGWRACANALLTKSLFKSEGKDER
jgi:hypothetical protein